MQSAKSSPDNTTDDFLGFVEIAVKVRNDRPLLNYASVPANNNLKSRLVLNCTRKYSKCIARHRTSLDFRLLFAGTEA